jgi:hypothetical protein
MIMAVVCFVGMGLGVAYLRMDLFFFSLAALIFAGITMELGRSNDEH